MRQTTQLLKVTASLTLLVLCLAIPSIAQSVTTVPLYRVFAHTTGVHFYTADPNRKLETIGAGWTAEGIAAYVLTQPAPGTVPLYVLQTRVRYGDYKSSDAVFGYVVDAAERDALLNSPRTSVMLCGPEVTGHGNSWWNDGTGVAGYIAKNPLPGTVPLFRLYHPPDFGPEESYRMSSITVVGTPFRRCKFGSYDNLYTTSVTEKESAITQHGYKFVSIIGYVWPSAMAVSMQPAKNTPKLPVSTDKPINVDTVLLKAGCLRVGMNVGQYGCANLGAFNACQSYLNAGLVKGCAYTATPAAKAAQKEMDEKLFSLGCTHFLGRSEEFLCKTPASYNACKDYRDNKKLAKRCEMAK